MFSRSDKDEELIKTIMKVKDMLAVSAAISQELFDWEYTHSAHDKNTMVLTIFDLIKEEDEQAIDGMTLKDLGLDDSEEDDNDNGEEEKGEVQT